MLKYTSDRLRQIRFILYSLTAIFYFIKVGDDIFGTQANIGRFVLDRCLFYVAEAVLLTILYIRSRKMPEQFDSEYFQQTVNFKKAADTCLVMIIIVALFAFAEMVPVIVYLPYDIFNGAASGPLVVLLLTGVTSALYFFVIRKFFRLKEQNDLLKPTPPEREDLYAFIHSNDGSQEKTAETEPAVEYMSDAASLIDETVPDDETFQRCLQQISLLNRSYEPAQLWECPFCGSLNPADSESCNFCGCKPKQQAAAE